ncbi:hypothetical protein CCACVL1_03439 [Corchorus capsularis]|uniref:Uncharacterized protein n=1 Tax=Corchorus capsularis TaxID=210143 RepID=A0A1R3JZH3_COCAP|nr:hypothetical protein CCACVL1_03439 [Corchorus capsularis]
MSWPGEVDTHHQFICLFLATEAKECFAELVDWTNEIVCFGFGRPITLKHHRIDRKTETNGKNGN